MPALKNVVVLAVLVTPVATVIVSASVTSAVSTSVTGFTEVPLMVTVTVVPVASVPVWSSTLILTRLVFERSAVRSVSEVTFAVTSADVNRVATASDLVVWTVIELPSGAIDGM